MHGPGNNPMIYMPNRQKQCYLRRMRGLFRLALLLLLSAGATALAQTVPPPQRPFSQLVDQWTRQLDRITYRTERADADQGGDDHAGVVERSTR